MSEERINMYEAMFLFPQAVAANMRTAVEHIEQLLSRAEAEIVSFAKFDERRLAYEIKGNKRGVYFLVYFKAAAQRIPTLERDCNLSEELLRAMILRADHIPAEQIEAAEGRSKLEDEIRLRGEEAESRKAAEAQAAEAQAAEAQAEAEQAEAAEETAVAVAEPVEDAPAGPSEEPREPGGA